MELASCECTVFMGRRPSHVRVVLMENQLQVASARDPPLVATSHAQLHCRRRKRIFGINMRHTNILGETASRNTTDRS